MVLGWQGNLHPTTNEVTAEVRACHECSYTSTILVPQDYYMLHLPPRKPMHIKFQTYCKEETSIVIAERKLHRKQICNVQPNKCCISSSQARQGHDKNACGHNLVSVIHKESVRQQVSLMLQKFDIAYFQVLMKGPFKSTA
jgi:hypothetical protein